MAEELLRVFAIEAYGALAVAPIRQACRWHLAGMELGDLLWGVIVLAAWLEQTSKGPGR